MTKAERSSPTSIRARSAQVMIVHVPAPWAAGAPSKSEAHMSRRLSLISAVSSIALRFPVEVRAAGVVGLAVATPVIIVRAGISGPVLMRREN